MYPKQRLIDFYMKEVTKLSMQRSHGFCFLFDWRDCYVSIKDNLKTCLYLVRSYKIKSKKIQKIKGGMFNVYESRGRTK